MSINLLPLYLLPFLYLPFFYSGFETPKVILFQIFALGAFITSYKLNFFRNIPKTYLFLVLAVFVPIIISSIFSFSDQTLFGNPTRSFGLVALLSLFAYFLMIVANSNYPKYTLPLISAILVLGFFFTDANDRAIGLIGEPNSFGAYFLFLWPFSIFSKKRPLIVLSLLISTVAIFLSGSKSVLIGFVIQISLYFLSRSLNSKFLAYIGIVLVLASSLLVIFERERIENRLEIWNSSVSAISEKPFLGFGTGNIENAIKYGADRINSPAEYILVDSAHNIFLDYMLWGGIASGVGLFVLILITLKSCALKKDIASLLAFIGVLASFMFNPQSILLHVAFWYLIGVGASRKLQKI